MEPRIAVSSSDLTCKFYSSPLGKHVLSAGLRVGGPVVLIATTTRWWMSWVCEHGRLCQMAMLQAGRTEMEGHGGCQSDATCRLRGP